MNLHFDVMFRPIDFMLSNISFYLYRSKTNFKFLSILQNYWKIKWETGSSFMEFII